MEKWILNLHYEVRGLENLPQKGSYIIVSKHQSAYETFKLFVLFDHPAIILKEELKRIPLWGWYAHKADMIGIPRGKAKHALDIMLKNTQPIVEQGRPIVIYPQGTRVPVGGNRPYKKGAIRLYEHFNIPLVPMALNSGSYWPKNSFIKKPGTVVFEILPSIPPGQSASGAFDQMKKTIEEKSSALTKEVIG